MSSFTCGPIQIRITKMEKVGAVCPGHTHNFDHVTHVIKGKVRVQVRYEDGRPEIDVEMNAPHFFLVEAHAFHTITALEDDSEFWCVYPHRTENGDVSMHFTGFEGAYL